VIDARALGGDYRRRPYAIRDGRMLAGPGEVIVGHGILDTLGLKVGDPLTLEAGGRRVTLRIVGRYIEPDNDGEVAIFDRRSVPAGALADVPVRYALQLEPGADAHALARELRAELAGAIDAEVTSDEVVDERDGLRPVIYTADAVLLLIGLVNLLTTLLLGVRDRIGDFAIFKVVGVTPGGVLAAVTSSGTVLAALAVAIGVPIGVVVFHAVVVLTNPTDGPDLVTTPTWWSLLALLPATLAFTTLASVLPAQRAAAVKPAEALRYE
jgi:putative ABC transport system permease protein